MWNLTPWPGMELLPPALEVENINHWTAREIPPLLHLTFTTKIGTGWEFTFYQNGNFGPVFYCPQGTVCFSKQAEEEGPSFSPEILITRNCQWGGSPISRPSSGMPLNSRKQKEQTPTQNMWKKKAMRSFKCLPPKFKEPKSSYFMFSGYTSALTFFIQPDFSGSSFKFGPSPKSAPNSENNFWEMLHLCHLWGLPRWH